MDKEKSAASEEKDGFDWKQRLAYWKKKWLREHRAWIACCVLAYLAAAAVAVWKGWYVIIGVLVVAGVFLYAMLRSSMMSYAEARAFDPKK